MKKGLEEGIQKGIEEGIEKGIEKGIEVGRVEEKRGIVQKMKSKGYPIEDIIDMTGLSAEEIEKL